MRVIVGHSVGVGPGIDHSHHLAEWGTPVLFSHLSLANVMLLLGCILLERTIIFQHKSKAVVSAACVALTGIMHPLWWGNTFITTLPESLPELLESPVCTSTNLECIYMNEVNIM